MVKLSTIRLASLKRVDTRDVEVWDDASDDCMLESENQKTARLQAQFRRDKERTKHRCNFEHK